MKDEDIKDFFSGKYDNMTVKEFRDRLSLDDETEEVKYIYLKGDESKDESVRFDLFTYKCQIFKNGVWEGYKLEI